MSALLCIPLDLFHALGGFNTAQGFLSNPFLVFWANW